MHDRDDDRPKPSWRDIDRRKDKSKHVVNETEKRQGRGTQRAASGYKSMLDNFFEGGKAPAHVRHQLEKLSPAGQESEIPSLARAVRQAVGSREVASAVDALLNASGDLPDDWDVLIQVLLHPDEERVRDAMARIDRLLNRRMPKRKDLLQERLRRLETLAEEEETKEAARALSRRL